MAMPGRKSRHAAIYTRISIDSDGERLGVARQEKDCLALAARLGWDVVAVHSDNSISAFSGKTRPGYKALLDDLRSGVADALIVWKPDRLHRRPVELEAFIDLVEQNNIAIATVAGGRLDLSTSEGRAMARVVGAFARMESEVKADRTRRKHLELAEAGKDAGGGTRPFGFCADRHTINPTEARAIQKAAKKLLGGSTLRSIASDLNRNGPPTVTGVPWTTVVVKRMLTSGRVCGWRAHHGRLVAPASWPAILDRDTVEAIRAILDDPSRRRRGNPRRYLLTGIAVCGCEGCGAKLVARPRNDGSKCYVCASGTNFKGCGKIRVVAEPLEEFVADLVCQVLDQPRIHGAKGRNVGPDADEASVAASEAKLRELAEQWAGEKLTTDEWMAARSSVEERLREAKARLVRYANPILDPYRGKGATLRKRWETLGFDRQRAIVESVVDSVIVAPAVRGRNFFDPDRVSIIWRA